MPLLHEMRQMLARRAFWLMVVFVVAVEISVSALGAILTGLKAEIGYEGAKYATVYRKAEAEMKRAQADIDILSTELQAQCLKDPQDCFETTFNSGTTKRVMVPLNDPADGDTFTRPVWGPDGYPSNAEYKIHADSMVACQASCGKGCMAVTFFDNSYGVSSPKDPHFERGDCLRYKTAPAIGNSIAGVLGTRWTVE